MVFEISSEDTYIFLKIKSLPQRIEVRINSRYSTYLELKKLMKEYCDENAMKMEPATVMMVARSLCSNCISAHSMCQKHKVLEWFLAADLPPTAKGEYYMMIKAIENMSELDEIQFLMPNHTEIIIKEYEAAIYFSNGEKAIYPSDGVEYISILLRMLNFFYSVLDVESQKDFHVEYYFRDVHLH